MSEKQLNEQQILDGLFETAAAAPEESVFLKRLGLRMTLSGLTASKVDNIRDRCTKREGKKGAVTETLDSELFNATLISEATTVLEVVHSYGQEDEQRVSLQGWGDSRITSRMKLSGGEQAIRRMLLAGELNAIGDRVLDLSGFGVDIDDVKN